MNHQLTRAALLGVSFAIAIAFFAFNYLPSQADLTSQQVLLDQQEQLVSHATSIPMQVTQVKQQLSLTEQFCADWRKRLATKEQLPTRFTAIVQLAESHGLHVIDFDPGETETLADVTRTPLDLTIETSYPNLVEFLADVEQSTTITWVKEAVLTAKQEGERSLTCKVTFVVFAENSAFSDDVKHAPHPIP